MSKSDLASSEKLKYQVAPIFPTSEIRTSRIQIRVSPVFYSSGQPNDVIAEIIARYQREIAFARQLQSISVSLCRNSATTFENYLDVSTKLPIYMRSKSVCCYVRQKKRTALRLFFIPRRLFVFSKLIHLY